MGDCNCTILRIVLNKNYYYYYIIHSNCYSTATRRKTSSFVRDPSREYGSRLCCIDFPQQLFILYTCHGQRGGKPATRLADEIRERKFRIFAEKFERSPRCARSSTRLSIYVGISPRTDRLDSCEKKKKQQKKNINSAEQWPISFSESS